MACSAAETTDIGSDTATRVTDDIADDTEWNGRVRCVELAIDDAEDADQLIAPEERYRIAMARR